MKNLLFLAVSLAMCTSLTAMELPAKSEVPTEQVSDVGLTMSMDFIIRENLNYSATAFATLNPEVRADGSASESVTIDVASAALDDPSTFYKPFDSFHSSSGSPGCRDVMDNPENSYENYKIPLPDLQSEIWQSKPEK